MWLLIFASAVVVVVVGLQCLLWGGFSLSFCHLQNDCGISCCRVSVRWGWAGEYQGGNRAPGRTDRVLLDLLFTFPFNFLWFLLHKLVFFLPVADGPVWIAELVRQRVLANGMNRLCHQGALYKPKWHSNNSLKNSFKFGSLNTILKYKWFLAEDFNTWWHWNSNDIEQKHYLKLRIMNNATIFCLFFREGNFLTF